MSIQLIRRWKYLPLRMFADSRTEAGFLDQYRRGGLAVLSWAFILGIGGLSALLGTSLMSGLGNQGIEQLMRLGGVIVLGAALFACRRWPDRMVKHYVPFVTVVFTGLMAQQVVTSIVHIHVNLASGALSVAGALLVVLVSAVVVRIPLGVFLPIIAFAAAIQGAGLSMLIGGAVSQRAWVYLVLNVFAGATLLMGVEVRERRVYAARLHVQEMGRREREMRERAAKVQQDLELELARRKQLESKLRNMAHTDPLTGLANRNAFSEEFGKDSATGPLVFAVIAVDLDGFKKVNDQLGHRAGDDVLKAAGERIARCIRRGDRLYRTGGDEFVAVICTPVTPDQVQRVGERIVELLSDPISIGPHVATIGASVGIDLVGGEPASCVEDRLSRADAAMYRAKAGGKGTVRVYEPGADSESTTAATPRDVALASAPK